MGGGGEMLWGGEGQGLLPATSLDVVKVFLRLEWLTVSSPVTYSYGYIFLQYRRSEG